MNYYSLFPLFSCIVNSLLCLYIIYINAKILENRLFFMLTFSVAFWSILHFFMFSTENASTALFWARLDTWGATFSSVFFLHFIIVYTKYKYSGIVKYGLFFLYIYALVFSLLDQTTYLVEKPPELHYWGYFSAHGSLYIFASFSVIACIITGLLLTIRFYFISKSENEKRQALLLITAISIPLVGGIVTEIIPTVFNIEVIPLTTTLSTIMAIIIGYTIHKYKLLIPLEYELKIVKEEYKKLFITLNALPDSIVLLTEEGSILETNKAMDENFGILDEDLIGKNLYSLLPKNVVDKRKSLALKALNTGTIQKNEDEIMNRYFHNLFIPTDSIRGESNVLMISKDVTEQRKAEKEKKQLEKQIQKSQKLKALGTMAGGIAHDFKNILTPILGFSNMALQKMNSSNSSYKYIEEINNAAQRAKEIIDQILRFSRESETKPKQVYLHVIVEEALKLLQSFIPSTIEIKRDIDTSCEKVLADSTKIHEVIINLCTNALHAMEDTGGVLTIELNQVHIDRDKARINHELKEQDYVRLTITDTGIGMSKEIKERIFDPFFTTKEVDKGTGLGLSVVHGIIKDHNGAISVTSTKGEGSTFTIYLPVILKKR